MAADEPTADAREALEAVPLAVVAVDRDHRPVWANRLAIRMASGADLEASRLFAVLAASEPVTITAATGAAASAAVALPTDVGMVERVVSAAPVVSADLVLATFVPPGALSDPEGDEARARLEAMLEHTVEMITVVDAEGRIRFSNAAAGRLTGLHGADVNGVSAFDLVHPDDLERASDAFQRMLSTPGPSEAVELRLRFGDGRWHDVQVRANNLLGVEPVDGLVLSVGDVTDRNAAEARREALLRNLSDVIVVLDEQFDVTWVSESIARIIEAPPATNLGTSAFDDVHPDDLAPAIEALASIVERGAGATGQLEVRLESRPGSGRWRWLHATAVNLLAEPAVAGIVVTLRDVTDQKEAALELQAAVERERANAQRLTELDRLKDDFLATVSHELRTPLAAILGFADLLRHEAIAEPIRSELIERIAASASDMRSMVENVLDFSALDAGSVTVELERVQLREAIASALRSVAHQLAEHNVDVEVGDGWVLADVHGLGHVLRNLLANAAKYSAAGSKIAVRTSSTGEVASISVADEGVGIGADDLPRIFDRFYRARNAAFAARGSGIGLNIAKRYAELMGGTIHVVSSPGAGSTFTVLLPVA